MMTDTITTMNNNLKRKAIKAITENKNIIICGPEMTGKTTIQRELIDMLLRNNYNVYFGVQEYHYRNRSKEMLMQKRFWIEETNNNLLSNVKENYEYIETISA